MKNIQKSGKIKKESMLKREIYKMFYNFGGIKWSL